MQNFELYNPTHVYFGKDVTDKLHSIIKPFGKKVLVVYGKNSIKQNGIYQQIMLQLEKAGVEVVEYSGIKSNPIIEDVDAAAELGKKHKVDMIVAVGGGSVIDSAKIISVAIPVNHTAWNFFNGTAKPKAAIPLIAVLTLAATGTEMNPYAVVQNHATNQKASFGSSLTYPAYSFLDPQFTLSVPANYTAYGIVDLIAHCLEAYFGKGEASLSDKFTLSIIKEALEYGPKLMQNLNSYELRYKIMYAATCALNGTTVKGKISGDWGVHGLGHVLSLLYDIPHGASLSIMYPAWMKLQLNKIPERFEVLSRELFNSNDAISAISGFTVFFKSLHCPITLKEANVAYKYEEIMQILIQNRVSGANFAMKESDYEFILKDIC